jgi:hypothetical protein
MAMSPMERRTKNDSASMSQQLLTDHHLVVSLLAHELEEGVGGDYSSS